ncbi:MAG: hypothetical protein DHS20C15_16540 [Planctomycetota bacterium]|nr:MAG: hypothetical protein DHS20C15_16540 [Planctomycetota bacterium]
MNRDDVCSAFLDTLPFDPYPFQEEAILTWFEAEQGLLVSAPTGMGKTLIAESAIFEALKTGKRVYYSTPLIALTDQKLTELQDRAEAWGFERDQVGLLTGNRKLNPEAPVLVVVAEILLNHLLSEEHQFDDVFAVVMDEFHWFNEVERGVVWELALTLLPKHVRLLLLSATVGNAVEFTIWLREKHERTLRLVRTDERKVPLEHHWVDDKLLTELLTELVDGDAETTKAPALVFCFSRDECWEMAERLKGLPLVDKEQKAAIEAALEDEDLTRGIGPKLRQMLIRGVGVHHAGVLPRHKAIVERLFLERLTPYVVCTETLAAGVNLPARSVVLRSILKGKPREKKLMQASSAHQMFGRAGRPQFDTQGHVFALAHEDDVKINRWKEKYEQIPAGTKDPSLLRARKQMERKRPTRRNTEQYWNEEQYAKLIAAPPANLRSRGMIPYRFLVWLLAQGESVEELRAFLQRRFNDGKRLEAFEKQLDAMLANLEALGHVRRGENESVEVLADVERLLGFRSVDPLYGEWLCHTLGPADQTEKLLTLESLLFMPYQLTKKCGPPWELPKGPLQEHMLEPLMISMGIKLVRDEPTEDDLDRRRMGSAFQEDPEEREDPPPTFPEMLKIAFESELAFPEDVDVQTKWVAGGIFDSGDFDKFVASRQLAKNEGLVMRHLLRFVLLAGEFHEQTDDPDYAELAAKATAACAAVDAKYTERFLDKAQEREGV